MADDFNAKVEEGDDDAFEPNSIHLFRQNSLDRRNSLRVLEERAFQVHEDHTRSIGGRLGGHFDSVRDLTDEALLTEASPLITKMSPKLRLSTKRGPPPLRRWIAPALTCASAYAFYNIFIKKGSASINPILGGVVLQFVAAILGTFLLAARILLPQEEKPEIHCDRKGFGWSVCAGIAVGCAEMLSFFVSSLGVQASQFIPVIIGGSVMFGAVLGLLVLGEKMMLHGWSGVLLLVTGIALVATDPGEKVEEGGGGD